jgi:hypothetical protein
VGLALDAAGNLYICDWSNYRVRKVTPNRLIKFIVFISGLPGQCSSGIMQIGFVPFDKFAKAKSIDP